MSRRFERFVASAALYAFYTYRATLPVEHSWHANVDAALSLVFMLVAIYTGIMLVFVGGE